MLDFCLWPKKWEIQIFLKSYPIYILPPGLFLNRAPPNILISIEIELLVLDMQCWYLFIFMLFREKGIYDLESCIRVTSNFLVFCNLLKKTKNYIILAWLPNQKSVNLRKRCAAAIITLTQMHTTIFVRFLKWAKITGHLSCLLRFFY